MTVPLPLRVAYPLSFLTGLLYWIAFPGIDVWPLAFVALVPLFVALAAQRPKHGFWLGFTAGFGMTITGFYWLSYTLEVFSGFPLPLRWLFQAILCGYQAGRIGLFGWLATRGEQRGWGRGVALALGFAASELLFPLLFPWFYGATVHQLIPLLQVAELGGPIAVSMVLVAVNYLLAELVLARLEKRPINRRVLGLAAVPILATVYGLIRVPMVDARSAAADKLEVGLVQANMSLMGKRKKKSEGLSRHLRATERLKAQGPLDLVVWSETSVMSPVQEEEVATALSHFTTKLEVPALFGSVLVKHVDDAREYVLFNSALLTDRSGKVIGRLDKQLLLAFGEYLPFGETFPILYEWSPHSGHFTPGTTYSKPLNLGERRIAVVICYEDVLPGFVNRLMNDGEPELLANLTNDAWFGDSTQPWIHLALAKLRAVEQRKFFVRSTNSGVSAFIDPAGRVISHTQPFEEETKRATLRWLKGKTPYTLWGDIPWWLVSALSVGFAFRYRKLAKKAEPETKTETQAGAGTESPEPAAQPEATPSAEKAPIESPAPVKPGFPKPGGS
ncbi:MAG TPA: apolipoprotein N-acyltransferase [Polyangiaceae bacterium]|nr:apolipoprotein N-acyltransferase [Polyangiaceae bacterium]